MRERIEYQTTVNRTVYNRLRKDILERDAKIHCSFCGYHKNENETNKWYGCFAFSEKYANSMIHYPNWKLVSKNRKQWMKKKLKKENLWRNPEAFRFII